MLSALIEAISKFIDKISIPFFPWLLIVSALLLILPNSIIDFLGLSDLLKKYRGYVGTVFLLTLGAVLLGPMTS